MTAVNERIAPMEVMPSHSAVDGNFRRWYVLFILVWAYAIHNLDKQIVSALIGPLKAEFAMSDFQVSILGGLAASVPFALVCIPMGMLADRKNRKHLLVILLLAWSLATSFAGFASTLAVLYLCRISVGALEAGFSPITMSLISDHFRPKERSTALGFFALGAPVGTFLAMAAGSYIAADYGWRMAFLLAGIPGVVLAIVIAFTIREPARGRYDAVKTVDNETASLKMALRYMLSDKALLHTFVGMVLCVALLACLAVWLPTFLVRVHSLSMKEAGIWSALVVGAVGALGAAAGGFVADFISQGRESRKLMMVIITTILAAVCTVVAMLFSPSLSVAVVLIGCTTFLAQSLFGTGYGLVIHLSAPNMRATVLAMLVVAFNLISYTVGSSVAGWVSDRMASFAGVHSITYGIAATTILSFWGAGHFFRAYQLLRQREPKYPDVIHSR
ncbi:MFS transporter [Noviherbaspirillum sedimenti]|nr:MFS transporter [Noviherbaspirillum sedimenti]